MKTWIATIGFYYESKKVKDGIIKTGKRRR